LAGQSVPRGESVEFVTWVCPGADKDSVYDAQRFVSLDDRPLFRFDEPLVLRAGDCASLRDRLDTAPMEPGVYSYTVNWNPEPGAEPVSAEIAFEVTDPDAWRATPQPQPGQPPTDRQNQGIPDR
jgi:hypothetical protein